MQALRKLVPTAVPPSPRRSLAAARRAWARGQARHGRGYHQ
eukprot:gene9182-5951_t